MANVQVEAVDPVRRRMVVEIPEQEVTREFDRAFSDLARTANVPGFRRGRVPRSVLERVAGPRLRAEVVERLVHDSFLDALRDERMEAVGVPSITTESGARSGQPLRYSATFEVKPEVTLGRYDGIAVERPLRVVDEADVDAFLERARQSAARIESIGDRTIAAADDIATVDYEARVGERTVGRGENRFVQVGGDRDSEMGAHLVGVEVGATVEFAIDYPSDFDNPDLAGKSVEFQATVKDLGTRVVPPLDDEFAKAYAGFDDLAMMRARVREELERQAVRDADASARTALIDALLREHDFEVPQGMVDRRTDGLISEVIAGMGHRHPPASQDREMRDRLRPELEPRARNQVRANILLEEIARAEGIDVDDDEVAAAIEREISAAGASAASLRSLFDDPSSRVALRLQMLREKALARVFDKANLLTVEEKSSVAGTSGNG